MDIQENAFSVERNGMTLRGTHYRMGGGQRPVVLLSHGFGGTLRDMEHYARLLAQWGFWAFAYDFCGGSPRSSSDGSFQDMTVFTEVADLEAVMAYVRSQPEADTSNLTLMGCSQGGFVSALTAAAHPDEVTRLVMFYPALCIPEDSRRGHMLAYSFDPANVPERIQAQAPEGVPFVTEPLGGGYVTSVQSMDAFAAIASYPGPVLIVHGDSDRAVNVVNSRRAQAAYHAVRPLRCQLAEITGADHGFRGAEDVHAMELVREFVRGGTNVLSVDVVLTDLQRIGPEGETILPFGGVVDTPFFSGLIQPGAVDVQRWRGEQIVRLCADYVICGHDYTGTPCSIHIVNENTGSGWHPTVTTDSKALSFLQKVQLTESLEMRRVGPMVRIFAKLAEDSAGHGESV